MLSLITNAALAVFILMVFTWALYLKLQNPGIIDVAWGLAISLAGLIYTFTASMTVANLLFAVCLMLWGLRLAGYLFVTRIIPGHVDKRYLNLSDSWKMKKALGFLLNFLFQGLLALIIAIPFLFIRDISQLSWLSTLALVLYGVGLIGESLSDFQLYQFKQHGNGEVCDKGLWHFSRHPNYFFEVMIWLGFALAALNQPYGIIALVSPGMLLFIMFYWTIPMTENSSIDSKGDAFREYQAKTSMFFPWPPKT